MRDQTKSDIFVGGGLLAMALGYLAMGVFIPSTKVRPLPTFTNKPQEFRQLDPNYKPRYDFYVQNGKLYRDPATMPEYLKEK